MSRKIVVVCALALTGALLVMPDPSSARGGGMRGSFRGVRGPVFTPGHASVPSWQPGQHARTIRLPVKPQTSVLARTTVRAPFVHLTRRSHGAYLYGSTYPVSGDDDGAYYGMPYDSGAAIPVYGPAASIQEVDPPAPPLTPRLSSARDENTEACRSEHVTVPAAKGDRDMLVVRC